MRILRNILGHGFPVLWILKKSGNVLEFRVRKKSKLKTIKQSLSIHSTSGNGGKPVKKIPASAAVLLTMKVEVQSPYNRISISHNRRGHRAFAVFLLSFFIGIRRRTVTDVRCRSPPLHLDFYISSQAKACSIQIDWRKKEWHITTDVRTGSGVSGKKPRKKCCGNMELMKLPLNKSV